jgi:hypothetical protein
MKLVAFGNSLQAVCKPLEICSANFEDFFKTYGDGQWNFSFDLLTYARLSVRP